MYCTILYRVYGVWALTLAVDFRIICMLRYTQMQTLSTSNEDVYIDLAILASAGHHQRIS